MADDYDDGVFSVGNMDRPALRRRMADIQMGKVDTVVACRIDRLSRSLADFARMVDVLDRHRLSFSAVTQQTEAALSAPHIVQSVWDRIRSTRPDLSEPEVVPPMRNLAGLWHQLFPAQEQGARRQQGSGTTGWRNRPARGVAPLDGQRTAAPDLLEPAIIQRILAGQQPKCMSLLWLQRNPLPTDWVAQREVVAAFDV